MEYLHSRTDININNVHEEAMGDNTEVSIMTMNNNDTIVYSKSQVFGFYFRKNIH